MLIFLTGFMGAGKTTAGKKLASQLGYKFTDLDDLIEKTTGKSISELFESGELHFREIESGILRETISFEDTVIATGGGTPCFRDNMDWMNEKGTTIYLRLSPGSLFHRLAESKKERPLIAGKTDVALMEYIMQVLPEREFFYSRSKIIYKGENLDIKELAGTLLKSVVS